MRRGGTREIRAPHQPPRRLLPFSIQTSFPIGFEPRASSDALGPGLARPEHSEIHSVLLILSEILHSPSAGLPGPAWPPRANRITPDSSVKKYRVPVRFETGSAWAV